MCPVASTPIHTSRSSVIAHRRVDATFGREPADHDLVDTSLREQLGEIAFHPVRIAPRFRLDFFCGLDVERHFDARQQHGFHRVAIDEGREGRLVRRLERARHAAGEQLAFEGVFTPTTVQWSEIYSALQQNGFTGRIIQQRLNGAFNTMLADPAVKSRLADMGVIAGPPLRVGTDSQLVVVTLAF